MKQLKKLLTTRNNNWLIQHFKIINPNTNRIETICSRKPGEVIKDSSGKHYIVHDDYSIRKYGVCINK